MSNEARAGMAFAVGALVPVGTLLVALPLAGAWGLLVGGSVLRPLAAIGLACVAGGWVAGGGLGRGVRPRVAFGLAFPVGLAIPLLVVSVLGALSGRESFAQLILGFVPGFVFAYGLLGSLGGALIGLGVRGLAQSIGVFAGGGAVGGLLLAGVVRLGAGAASPALAVAEALGVAVACAAPAALGGRWIAAHGGPPRKA